MAAPDLRSLTPRVLGPVRFTLFWLGTAFVVLLVVGVLAGLVRDDVAGTLGGVMGVGLLVTAAALVGIVLVADRSS